MSRHNFFPKDDGSDVLVVGWDAALQSFFLQYGDPGSDLPLAFATGQRPAEHPTPELIVALANHLGERVPADLSAMLQRDRAAEGFSDGTDVPENVVFTTQAHDGAEIGFAAPRTTLAVPGTVAAIADHILNGDALRSI